MPVNIVIYGDEEIINLTDATATEDTILKGSKAYGSKGQLIQGKALGFKSRVTISRTAPSNPITGDLWIKSYVNSPPDYRYITTEGLSIPKDINVFNGYVITGILLSNLTDMQSLGEDGVSNLVLDSDDKVRLIFKATGCYSSAYPDFAGWYPDNLYAFDGTGGDWIQVSSSDEGYLTVELTDHNARYSSCWIENKETGITIYAPLSNTYRTTFSIPFEGDWVVNCVKNNVKQSKTVTVPMEDETVVQFTF